MHCVSCGWLYCQTLHRVSELPCAFKSSTTEIHPVAICCCRHQRRRAACHLWREAAHPSCVLMKTWHQSPLHSLRSVSSTILREARLGSWFRVVLIYVDITE